LHVAQYRIGKGGKLKFLPEQLKLWDQLTMAFIEPSVLLHDQGEAALQAALQKHYKSIYGMLSGQ
jgi:hypothetical protein